jgi:hypothetical protein
LPRFFKRGDDEIITPKVMIISMVCSSTIFQAQFSDMTY